MFGLGLTLNSLENTTANADEAANRFFFDVTVKERVLPSCPPQYTSYPGVLSAMAIGNIRVKAVGSGEPIYEGEPSNTKVTSGVNNIEERVFKKLVFPSYWEKEGVSKPNFSAKKNAFEICKEIFMKYDLEPDKILASRESGVFISYDSSMEFGERSLIIETYNNLETAIVISDNENKEIMYSEDVHGLDFENAIQIFKAKPC